MGIIIGNRGNWLDTSRIMSRIREENFSLPYFSSLQKLKLKLNHLCRERFAEYRIDIKRNFVNENVRSKLNRFLEEELETSYRKFSRERIILKREGRT